MRIDNIITHYLLQKNQAFFILTFTYYFNYESFVSFGDLKINNSENLIKITDL